MQNKLAKLLAVLLSITFVVGGFVLTGGHSDDTIATPTDLDPIPDPDPEPEPEPDPDPVYGSVTVNKQLVGDIWHIRCDYMDGTDFHAGGGIWKRDLISNPEGELSQEGHRSNKCGNDDNWVIWVGTDGTPYRMDEIKSGATGGTLPTVIYSPRYNLTTDEIRNMSVDDTDMIWRYSQNFIDVMNWSDIRIGQRMYWTTASGGHVWSKKLPLVLPPNETGPLDFRTHTEESPTSMYLLNVPPPVRMTVGGLTIATSPGCGLSVPSDW